MAVELCSEKSGISPRISFSHDLCLSDIIPVEQLPLRSKSSSGSIDFDFCVVRKSFDQESSSADELFSDGKILPTEIKKKTVPPKQTDRTMPPSQPLHDENSSNIDQNSKTTERLKETKSSSDEAEEKQSSKSFWRFKRSSSLNCGSGYGRTLCPLPLLSRSNSTGSTPSVKRSPLSRESHGSNHKHHKQASMKSSSLSSSSSSSSSSSYQKPPLKKNYGSYSNGVRVINVPSGNLFGLGSVFFNGKDKNKKK